MSKNTPRSVTIFFSYAGRDYDHWMEGFEKYFSDKLKRKLEGAINVEKIFSYKSISVQNGNLDTELRKLIANSSAMVIFVGENYVPSKRCVKELKFFEEIFGEDGLDNRLFIVAMSQPALDSLTEQDHWREIMKGREQTALEFWSSEQGQNAERIKLYLEIFGGKGMAQSPAFDDKLNPLVLKVVDCLKLPQKSQDPANSPVRKNNIRRWVIGVNAKELNNEVQSLVRALKQNPACKVEQLSIEELLIGDFSKFDQSSDLVLAFNKAPCGQLDLQRRAWVDAGKSIGNILWFDLSAIEPIQAGTNKQLEALDKLVGQTFTIEQLIAMNSNLENANHAVIYIECNDNEKDHWHSLGRHLRPYWQSIVSGDRLPPQLSLIPRPLPINQLETLVDISEADGVILLWGSKPSESLVAQVTKVERQLKADPELPPGIVAYLSPPHEYVDSAILAYGWRVLRFDARDPNEVDLIAAESDRMEIFLREVHTRVMKRRKSVPTRSLTESI